MCNSFVKPNVMKTCLSSLRGILSRWLLMCMAPGGSGSGGGFVFLVPRVRTAPCANADPKQAQLKKLFRYPLLQVLVTLAPGPWI